MKRAGLIYIMIISILLFYLVFGHNGLLKYKEMIRIQEEYQNLISEMDERIVFLNRELELLKKDNAYMDYVIRRELGVQKPDEDQYITSDNAAISSK